MKVALQNPSYVLFMKKIETTNILLQLFDEEQPEIVIHLAAQAGVRHSIDNPRSYLESNTSRDELLEAARTYPQGVCYCFLRHPLYGASVEYLKTAEQIIECVYAATKKATENMAHSYAHLSKLPITMFRFFTVYGPWGRPDMALFKFTKKPS